MLKPYESKVGYDVKLVIKIRGYTPADNHGNEQVNHFIQQSQNQTTELILRQAGYGTLHLPFQVRHGGDQLGGLHQAGMSTERIRYVFSFFSYKEFRLQATAIPL